MRAYVLMLLLMAALCVSLTCTSDRRKGNGPMLDDSLSTDIATVQQSRIYFGHHSVGNNILRGMHELASVSAGAGIPFQPLTDTLSDSEYFFSDSYIGENTHPESKCAAFAQALGRFKKHLPEIAFMKFCFVDFGQGMKAEAIMSLYASMIDSLKQQYPDVAFIHVTAPLTARRTGFKTFIKQLLGRGDRFESDNMERNTFNALLLSRFAADPIFDLARIESTRPDGTREQFWANGRSYYALVPEYSDDGGHLNDIGQRLAGRELIRTLAQTLRARRNNFPQALLKN